MQLRVIDEMSGGQLTSRHRQERTIGEVDLVDRRYDSLNERPVLAIER